MTKTYTTTEVAGTPIPEEMKATGTGKCQKCHVRDCPMDDNCNAPIKQHCKRLAHSEPIPEDWEVEFVKTFYVYNLKTGTPAGAEKEAVDFILCKKQQWEADARREGYTDGFGAGLQQCTGDRKCTCGEPKL